jgi:hypothetical protein
MEYLKTQKKLNESSEKLNISDIITSDEFRSDIESAIENSYDFSWSIEGSSDYFNEQRATKGY